MHIQWLKWSKATWKHFFNESQKNRRVNLFIDDDILNYSFNDLGGKNDFIETVKKGPNCRVLGEDFIVFNTVLNPSNLKKNCLAIFNSREDNPNLHFAPLYGNCQNNIHTEGCFFGLQEHNIPPHFLYLLACIYTANFGGAFYIALNEKFNLTLNSTELGTLIEFGFLDKIQENTNNQELGFFIPDQLGSQAHLSYIKNECLFSLKTKRQLPSFFNRLDLNFNHEKSDILARYRINETDLDNSENPLFRFHDDIIRQNEIGKMILQRLYDFLQKFDGAENNPDPIFNKLNPYEFEILLAIQTNQTAQEGLNFNGFKFYIKSGGSPQNGNLKIPNITDIEIDNQNEYHGSFDLTPSLAQNGSIKGTFNYEGKSEKVRVKKTESFEKGFMFLEQHPETASFFIESENTENAKYFVIINEHKDHNKYLNNNEKHLGKFNVFTIDWLVFNAIQVDLTHIDIDKNNRNFWFYGGEHLHGQTKNYYRSSSPLFLRVVNTISIDELKVEGAKLLAIYNDQQIFHEYELIFDDTDGDLNQLEISVSLIDQPETKKTIYIKEFGSFRNQNLTDYRVDLDLKPVEGIRGWNGYNHLEANDQLVNEVILEFGKPFLKKTPMTFGDINLDLNHNPDKILTFKDSFIVLDRLIGVNSKMRYGYFKTLFRNKPTTYHSSILKKLCLLGHAEIEFVSGRYNAVIPTKICGNLLPWKFNCKFAVALTGTYTKDILDRFVRNASANQEIIINIQASSSSDNEQHSLPPRVLFAHNSLNVLIDLFKSFTIPIISLAHKYLDFKNDFKTIPDWDNSSIRDEPYIPDAEYFELSQFTNNTKPWVNYSQKSHNSIGHLARTDGDTSRGQLNYIYYFFEPNNKVKVNPINNQLDMVIDEHFPWKMSRIFSTEKIILRFIYEGNLLNHWLSIENNSLLLKEVNYPAMSIKLPPWIERLFVSCSGVLPELVVENENKKLKYNLIPNDLITQFNKLLKKTN